MNVDVLESNPDWRWFLLFGGSCITLTVLVWVIFKYGRLCVFDIREFICSVY
jgi:hypothetical protein